MPTAFLRKPFKTVCVDTVLFFAMFALVGHITINYWERYTIQNELFSMKHSLHTLKNNIGNIGKAYDTLHTQLKSLIQEVDKKQIDTPECRHKEKLEAKCKTENNINIKHRNYEVQTTIAKSSKLIPVSVDVPIDMDNNKKSCGCEDKATGPQGINVSTNTRNPPKSTGTTSSDISNDIDHFRKKTCFEDSDDYRSRHVCHGTSMTGRRKIY